ncbi:ATP-binding cassette domain-containing protein [Psychrobacillus psychrodurans]|uniref:methionine ABC transporter ATP-binding protein n=1 Tax=Psychrobacillus psychrodurans TaxID=126157 RepID=UPI0008F23C12|nr:ATP-binding cassette domain-containing protein [Psychrobacillus psychrodurans]MCK1997864.1 ATP-binding cassette domain-containing protein [Psychrobacillus psychrodurans]MCZ8541047.1 ATP-binding cassette domain-containing protein [Psychrobacillus psychrodurans]SFM83393.1 D-methionine transport system ATP-binding protein [Psychrobacillus psychrodurans]
MIKLHKVSKSYSRFQAIKSISITVNAGEIHGIIGASGAGKSTVLRLMNLLEIPEEGEVEVNGQTLTNLHSKELRQARKSIGMIFQQYNLVANKTVYENVAVSLELANFPREERKSRVGECLQFVGLESLKDKYPAQLSGGQKQRVAIARALANNPRVLLCDEPTSSLDPNTTAEILSVLENINKSFGVTIVIVSHEMEVIKSICNRVTVMADGEVYDTVTIKPKRILNTDNSPKYFVEQLTKVGEMDHA